jgi:2-(1,2-epoxy-1,2-dihydrophenyl)acetyl-CoA isomerase
MPVDHSAEYGVAILTLNRPEVLNAFDDELGRDLLELVEETSRDDDVRCIVITGVGRAFSSGEDLGALSGSYAEGRAPPLGDILRDRYNPLIKAVRRAPKPVIGALNGVAAGAGASLALACDFRIASERARLVLAFIKVGLVPDSAGVWFLANMVGAATAWKLAALGDPLSAEEALALGLVNRVVPADDFEDSWRSFAYMLADGPTLAYGLTKSLVYGAAERSLEEQLDAEIEAQTRAGRSDDHLEGVRSFLEKRPPRFEGH